ARTGASARWRAHLGRTRSLRLLFRTRRRPPPRDALHFLITPRGTFTMSSHSANAPAARAAIVKAALAADPPTPPARGAAAPWLAAPAAADIGARPAEVSVHAIPAADAAARNVRAVAVDRPQLTGQTRHIVAARDIAAGELILAELAVLCAPADAW